MIVQCLLRSFGRIMGCLFGCFRVRDENHRRTHLVSSKHTNEALASRNRLASLLISHDNGASPGKGTNDPSLESPGQNRNDRELKEEAKFLKSCGTLLETPAEIRNKSERLKDLLQDRGDEDTSEFHSWLPHTSIKKLQWEEQPNQVPISPAKLCGDPREELGSPEREYSSCLSSDQKLTGKKFLNYLESSGAESSDAAESVSSGHPTVTTEGQNKSVRFEFNLNTPIRPLHDLDIKQSEQSDSSGSHNGTKYSPYPTPLKLTDEMQTPGTVYPANAGNIANARNARIRSQYVYPVLNPVQNLSQLMVLKEDDYCTTYNQVDPLRESLEQSEDASPEHKPVSDTSELAMDRESTVGKTVNVDESLSHWLKPPLSVNVDKVQTIGHVYSGGSPNKTPVTERPILGMVAAHWNDDDNSRISPKWWDGNGIPNSTNKYKEDQKVSWHATPFEERLEKALSNETLVCQRRLSSGPVDFGQNDESDTAMSRLQSTSHSESVVSF